MNLANELALYYLSKDNHTHIDISDDIVSISGLTKEELEDRVISIYNENGLGRTVNRFGKVINKTKLLEIINQEINSLDFFTLLKVYDSFLNKELIAQKSKCINLIENDSTEEAQTLLDLLILEYPDLDQLDLDFLRMGRLIRLKTLKPKQ